MSRLSNKIAVVTGGGSGIGLAAARRLADEGAAVVIVGRDPETLKDAAKAIGGAIDPVTADVAKTDDLDQLFATVRERHGRTSTSSSKMPVLQSSALCPRWRPSCSMK